MRFAPLFLSLAGLGVFGATGAAHGGEIAESQQKWFERYKKQENTPDPAKMLLNTDPQPDISRASGDWVSLFNGKDLTGWTLLGGRQKFEAQDGMILGTCVPDLPSGYLSTDKNDFADFIFTCEIKWEVQGNTGVMFRAQTRPGKDAAPDDLEKIVVYGPQFEMEGFGGFSDGRGWSGGIYGQACGGYYYPLWLKAHADVRKAQMREDWNRLVVHAQGKVVKTWVNGIPAAHWIDEEGLFTRGYFGLQVHKGKTGKIWFRDIRVLPLQP